MCTSTGLGRVGRAGGKAGLFALFLSGAFKEGLLGGAHGIGHGWKDATVGRGFHPYPIVSRALRGLGPPSLLGESSHRALSTATVHPMSSPSDTSEPWFVTAFRADYRELYAHRDDHAAEEEVAHLIEQGLQGPVLDLCCGFGRHAAAMTRRGLDVVGVDLSAELLRSADSHIAGRLARCDARSLPFKQSSFAGLVNLFSSFGYFGEDGDLEVLDEIARVLMPSGVAFMDLMNPEFVHATLVPFSEREEQGVVLTEERALENDGLQVVKQVCMTRPDGEVRRWREEVRLYTVADLAESLQERGIEVESVAGAFDGRPLAADTPRQLLRLSRR